MLMQSGELLLLRLLHVLTTLTHRIGALEEPAVEQWSLGWTGTVSAGLRHALQRLLLQSAQAATHYRLASLTGHRQQASFIQDGENRVGICFLIRLQKNILIWICFKD